MSSESQRAVVEVERRLLPAMSAFAEELRGETTGVQIEVWSSPTGSRSDYQGHDLGVDCLFEQVSTDCPNNVALIVGLMHLTSSQTPCEAHVVWGHPSGSVEAELIDDPAPFTEDALTEIEARLPELFSALRKALKRGKPADWESV